MAKSIEETALLLFKIEENLSASRRGLRFEPTLEALFQSDRNQIKNKQTAFAGIIAIIAYILLLSFVYADEKLLPGSERFVVHVSLLFVIVPAILVVILALRGMRPQVRDFLSGLVYLLLTAGVIINNHYMLSEYAAGDAFTSVMIPITCNIALPVSFRTAAIGSFLSVSALIIAVLTRLGIPPDIKSDIVLLYVVGAVLTLVANYRHEVIDRYSYLAFLRETLRNENMSRFNEELAVAASTDALTGLPNRRSFEESFSKAVALTNSGTHTVSLLMIDIDHFKLYNDIYGHPAGDKCLTQISKAIHDSTLGYFAARLGGEEFAVLLEGATADVAKEVAVKIQQSIRALSLPHLGLGKTGRVTVSIGSATCTPRSTESPEELLQRADAALYKSKRSGRDRIEVDTSSAA